MLTKTNFFQAFLCLFFFLTSSPAVLSSELERYAFVLGNSSYPEFGSYLENPIHDSNKLAHTLQEYGFKVETNTNLSQEQTLMKIDMFGELVSVHPNSVVVFYYSGHGIQVNSENYLIPVDAQTQNPDLNEMVRLSWILERISKAALKIIILDACRTNPFLDVKNVNDKILTSSGLIPFPNDSIKLSREAQNNLFIAYSASPGSFANDDGLYVDTLTKIIPKPQDFVDTFRQVSEIVKIKTQNNKPPKVSQVPWNSVPALGYKFCFPSCKPCTGYWCSFKKWIDTLYEELNKEYPMPKNMFYVVLSGLALFVLYIFLLLLIWFISFVKNKF
ncbi:caspase family protein [Candidatus Venteria ishoeyi]|uniref:Caspase domain protein n=1 Tax=Candidatus Venteria ishoeyi TaxID=1899563 RepID=A0A1H6F7E4_9GAMM|nr:caspase family protein [Candidatus Venteria ishoeyi]SEH05311.1 Caspase domain protein [Candidatus Venteria ishoeyi]